MSALVPLHHIATAVVVRTLLDHSDNHSPECKSNAQNLISKLTTNLYTAVSKDLLDLFVESYPRQLPAFLLPVLAPPHLRVLNLKKCCVLEEDSQVEFKYLKETLKRCSKLQALELDGCNLALPLLLCDVITQHAPQLVSISVEECRGISNEFVQKLLRGLPKLSHLNIAICPEVTDNVFALSETQGLLEERGGTQDSACGGCHLSSVDLSGNQQLTSTCIRHLTELCGPRLRNLNVAATRMDCTILWFLCGYSLSTAVQLAAEANKAIMDDNPSDGEMLSQLITEFRVLQEKLKNLQEEECHRQGEERERMREKLDEEEVEIDGEVQADDEGHKEVEILVAEGQGQGVEAETGFIENTKRGNDEATKKDSDKNAQLDGDKNQAEEAGQKEDGIQAVESQKQIKEDEEGSWEDTRRKEEIKRKDGVTNSDWDDKNRAAEEGQKEDNTQEKAEQQKMKDGERSWDESRRGGLARKDEEVCVMDGRDHIEQEGQMKNIDDSIDDLDLALRLYVTDIIDDCKKGLQCERSPQVCYCAHFQDMCQSSACQNCIQHNHREKPNNVCSVCNCERISNEVSKGCACKLGQTDSANGSASRSSTGRTSANETSDITPGADYSCDCGSSHKQSINASDGICKLDHTASTHGSGCKTLQPTRTSNETQDEKKTTICPWRRLYTPCIASLDMSIIDFDATLVVTCLKEFFLANKQLKNLTVCWKELTDSMLEIIASGGTELQSLCLVDCSSLTSLGVAHLLSKCRNLQQLDLQGVCYITDVALMPIFLQGDSCNLHTLKLSETNISDSTLTRIAKYLGKKITTLEISWCEEISDKGMVEVAKHCTALKTLTLRQCCMAADTLMTLAWNCTGLASLNMSGVENLTDGVVQAMMPSLRHLKKLDISWNSDVTDTAISSVLSCCPLVVELYLMGLKRITEMPFMPIISELARWQRCKSLIKLKMKERTLLNRLGEEQFSSDEEYEDLFSPLRSTTYAPCLRVLELHYCDRVNDDLLAELVAICVGTLSVVDYYGMQIVPKLLKMNSSSNGHQ